MAVGEAKADPHREKAGEINAQTDSDDCVVCNTLWTSSMRSQSVYLFRIVHTIRTYDMWVKTQEKRGLKETDGWTKFPSYAKQLPLYAES